MLCINHFKGIYLGGIANSNHLKFIAALYLRKLSVTWMLSFYVKLFMVEANEINIFS